MVESRSPFSLACARFRSLLMTGRLITSHSNAKSDANHLTQQSGWLWGCEPQIPCNWRPLQDLYVHELKDLYSAEKQLIKALPKMAKAAKDDKLTAGFEEHLNQTKEHAARIERILANHKKSTRGSRCKGMEGIIAEGEEMVEEEADSEVKDAGLISAAQRVEHYEIAGYGTARTYAEILGDGEGAKLLQATLGEEEDTDRKLTKLAKSSINVAAAR
jgi:ferritin-like metal-binding protein YciE